MANETAGGRRVANHRAKSRPTDREAQLGEDCPQQCAGGSTPARVPPPWGGPLNESDYAALDSSWISREIADAAMLRRVDENEGREVVGQKGKRDCAGILIPYYWPETPHAFNYRLRRDNPDWTQGKNGVLKPERKYLSPPNGGNRLFLPPGVSIFPTRRSAALDSSALASAVDF